MAARCMARAWAWNGPCLPWKDYWGISSDRLEPTTMFPRQESLYVSSEQGNLAGSLWMYCPRGFLWSELNENLILFPHDSAGTSQKQRCIASKHIGGWCREDLGWWWTWGSWCCGGCGKSSCVETPFTIVNIGDIVSVREQTSLVDRRLVVELCVCFLPFCQTLCTHKENEGSLLLGSPCYNPAYLLKLLGLNAMATL